MVLVVHVSPNSLDLLKCSSVNVISVVWDGSGFKFMDEPKIGVAVHSCIFVVKPFNFYFIVDS